MSDLTQQPVVKETRQVRRCPVCGWFLGKYGHCANEVPVQGGWLWEHR